MDHQYNLLKNNPLEEHKIQIMAVDNHLLQKEIVLLSIVNVISKDVMNKFVQIPPN